MVVVNVVRGRDRCLLGQKPPISSPVVVLGLLGTVGLAASGGKGYRAFL